MPAKKDESVRHPTVREQQSVICQPNHVFWRDREGHFVKKVRQKSKQVGWLVVLNR